MKKLLTVLAFLGVIAFSTSQAYAQETDTTQAAATEEVAPVEAAPEVAVARRGCCRRAIFPSGHQRQIH